MAAAQEASAFRRRLLAPLPRQLEVLERVLAQFSADVLVDTVLSLAPRVMAEQRALLHASIASATHPIPTSDDLFPFGWAQPPARDPTTRQLLRFARAYQDALDREEVVAWDAARAALGLPPTGAHPWRAASSANLVLLPSAAAYEYRRSDLPRQYWFVGALARHAGERALPPRVAALGDERPIVLVCQGTAFNDDPVVLKLAFAALAEEPVHVVGAVARPFDPAEFAPLPSNVILERYVPFPAMLSRSAVMITHAGAGAVHAALSHGVPVVALPLEVDQLEVAARAEHSGAGVVLDVHSCTRDQLRAAVRRRLQDPGQRAAAARLGAGYRASGGPELAAALLERLADTRAPVLRPDGDDPWASDAPAVAP